MLVLCSNGLSSQILLSALSAHTSNRATAALVVTADNVYKEKNHHVSRCIHELECLGLSVDTFDLDSQNAEELLGYDVVEFIGGNPYYLLDSIRKHDAAGVLERLTAEKILIGWSAAAFVFGPTLALLNRYTPEMNFLGLTDLKGLNLTAIEVLPHYSKFIQKFDRFEQQCAAYEAENQVTVIRLNDGDGIIITGRTYTVCRA